MRKSRIYVPSDEVEPGMVRHDLRGRLAIAISEEAAEGGDGAAPLLAAPVARLPAPLLQLRPDNPLRVHGQRLIDKAREEREAAKHRRPDPAVRRCYLDALRRAKTEKAADLANTPTALAVLDEIRAPNIRLDNMFYARELFLPCGPPPLTDVRVILSMCGDPDPVGISDTKLYLREIGARGLHELLGPQRWELVAQVWELNSVGEVGGCFNVLRRLLGFPWHPVAADAQEGV